MEKFIVIYHAPSDAFDNVPEMTPEQKAEGMKPWMEWKDRVGITSLILAHHLWVV